MKQILIHGLALLALILTACSNEKSRSAPNEQSAVSPITDSISTEAVEDDREVPIDEKVQENGKDEVEIESEVERSLIYAENDKFIIKVDRLHNDLVRYSSWSKPKTIDDKTDLQLSNGEIEMHGSAGGYTYSFKNGDWQYLVEDIQMGETDESMGIFLKLLKNDEVKMRARLQDLNIVEYQNPFIGVWGKHAPIIIADAGDEGYYISFEGGDFGFIRADLNADFIKGTNFSGKFTIHMISYDPPQFHYSDDGRGHFEPITNRKYEKIVSDNAKLLIGRWQSLDDEKSIVEYTSQDIITYYEGEFLDREPYLVTPKCMNYSEVKRSLSDEIDYISTIESDMCWSIISVDESHLTLSYTARGNSLAYKRIE